MKLIRSDAPQDQSVIKNFAAINSSIVFSTGTLAVFSESQTMAGLYAWGRDGEFTDFGVYNTQQLLSGLKLTGEDADIKIDVASMQVGKGARKLKMALVSPTIIKRPPAKLADKLKDMKHVTIKISKEDLKAILDGAAIFSSEEVSLVVQGDKVTFMASNSDDSNSNSFGIDLACENGVGSDFKRRMHLDYLRLLLTGNYEVKLYEAGITLWQSEAIPELSYFVSCQPET